jgi:hypothetical protein
MAIFSGNTKAELPLNAAEIGITEDRSPDDIRRDERCLTMEV